MSPKLSVYLLITLMGIPISILAQPRWTKSWHISEWNPNDPPNVPETDYTWAPWDAEEDGFIVHDVLVTSRVQFSFTSQDPIPNRDDEGVFWTVHDFVQYENPLVILSIQEGTTTSNSGVRGWASPWPPPNEEEASPWRWNRDNDGHIIRSLYRPFVATRVYDLLPFQPLQLYWIGFVPGHWGFQGHPWGHDADVYTFFAEEGDGLFFTNIEWLGHAYGGTRPVPDPIER